MRRQELEAPARTPPIRLPVDAKYKLYDRRPIDQGDVYRTFFYAFAYATGGPVPRPARAVILYPRDGSGGDVGLRVDTHAGQVSARIQAFGVDVESALEVVARGRPTVGDVPALGRLYGVFQEVLAGSTTEVTWLAS